MSDHAAEVRYLLTDARQLTDALGWSVKAKPNGSGLLIRCPAHEDSDPSCGITKGPDGTLRSKCHACGWGADALGMIALARGLSCSSPDDFRLVLVEGAEIGGDLRLADEIRGGQSQEPRQRVQPPEPEPEREYPPIAEVGKLWAMSQSVEADPDANAHLRSRSICPVAATSRGLAHVLTQEVELPGWAGSKGGPWSKTGHRLIVRAWDATGKLRSVRSWQLYGGSGPKRLPPAGHKQAGLVQANGAAVKMLLGQGKAGRVLICEGEPDWLTRATRTDPAVAVFGIGSGSWTKQHADRLPKGCEILILTHRDNAGHKYAADITATLDEKSHQVWRLDGAEGPDENDRAKSGQLPDNPRDGCVPWNDAARRVLEEEPRIFTVVEMMQDVHRKLTTREPPTMWTSGHWKVDLLTGGLRPDTGWVVGAASNWGKTRWLGSVCDENMRGWRNPTVPLIVSAEDSEELYAQALLARRARVNAFRLRDNCLTADEHKRVCAVLQRAEPKPHYLDGRCVTFERLLRQIVDAVKRHDIKIVALDYIQELRTKAKCESERVMFREIARTFRHTMKQMKVASIILTQLTNPEAGKAPTKDNIRECKDIGHGAEVVALGWEPSLDVPYGGATFAAGSKLLLLDKAKSGGKQTIGLDWDPVSACFNRVLRQAGDSDDSFYHAEANTEQSMWMDEFNEDIDAAIVGRHG